MSKKLLVFIFLLIIALTSALFVKLGFSKGWFESYLSVNKPVPSELLILEGWVSDQTISRAAEEFHAKAYTRVLTSGSPTDPDYLLPEDGFLEFSFGDPALSLHKNDSISFTLKGTPAKGIFPEFLIYINDQQFAGGFTSGQWETYWYTVKADISVEKISIAFINDTHHMGEDRNLQVNYLTINSTQYPARSSRVKHYKHSDPQRLNPQITNFGSVAEKCAHELQKAGVPGQMIEAVPSPVSDINRTLASAIILSSYIESQGIPCNTVNIMSEGIHARRSWISYKYALGKQASEVGIICVSSDRSFNTGLQFYTNKEIMRELASILYYKLVFNKNRYRKALTQQHLPV